MDEFGQHEMVRKELVDVYFLFFHNDKKKAQSSPYMMVGEPHAPYKTTKNLLIKNLSESYMNIDIDVDVGRLDESSRGFL